jgi:hypothetical protein
VWIILTIVFQANRVCPGVMFAGAEGWGVLLQARYVPFNFAKECVYIVINGGLVELNNSDCAKCR